MARVQVPFEALRRTTRERKYILEEIESLLKRVQPGQSGTSSIAEQVGTLNTLVEQLQSLKCKVGSAWAETRPWIGHVLICFRNLLQSHGMASFCKITISK